MEQYTEIFNTVAAFFVGAGVCFAFTPTAATFAVRAGALDIPLDGRRMHRDTVPRAGGLAVLLGIFLSAIAFAGESSALHALLAGGALIAAAGVTDDIFSLSPALKFLAECAAALTAVSLGAYPERVVLFSLSLSLSQPLGMLLGMLWILTITNAVNFIDGLDGLASGYGCAAFSFLAVISLLTGGGASAPLAAGVAGACAGFLPHNLPPARIFLGDTGALLIGFALAVLTLSSSDALLLPMLLIAALPLSDLVISVVRRIAAGKSPLAADRGHLHHRLIDGGYGVKKSVFALVCVSMAFDFCAVASAYPSLIGAACASVTLVLLAAARLATGGKN